MIMQLGRSNTNTLDYIFYFLIVALILVLEIGDMFSGKLDDESSFTALNYIIVALLACTCSYIILNKEWLPHDNLSKRYKQTTIVFYILTVLWSLFFILPQRNVYGYSILPIFLYFYIAIFIRRGGNELIIIGALYVVAILLSLYYFSNYYNNISYDITHQYNASYIILYFLPFMLCVKWKVFRIVGIVVTLIAIMFSLKRGGFIAFAVGVSIYYYIYLVKIQKKRFKVFGWVVLIVLALGVSWLIINVNNNYLDDMMFTRLDDIQESGGSGRMDLFLYHLGKLYNSNPIELIFGHGWCGTIRGERVPLTAHNDFIEVIYDFGIFGFVYFIMFIISLLKFTNKLIKDKSEYAPAMGASLGIFFTNSMVSHIWIYYKYQIVFALFWGLISASYKKYATLKR